MPSNRIYKFKDIREAEYFLNGAVFGGRVLPVSGLVGKTLKLTLPSVRVVTFTPTAAPPGGDSTALLFKDIKAQIEAVATDVRVVLLDHRLCIAEVTTSGGVKVDKTGTATALLGFGTTADTTGKVYMPADISITPPCWVGTQFNDCAHVLYTWE